MPRQKAGRSMKRSSGSACTMCRTPTSFGWSTNRSQLLRGIVGLQIDPANDARHERIRVGQLEQPSGFLERLARLHRDTGVDGRAVHLASQHRPAESRGAARPSNRLSSRIRRRCSARNADVSRFA